MSRLYTAGEVGELEIVLRLSAILIVVAGLRYEMAIIVEQDDAKAHNLTRLSLILNFIFSCILFILLLLWQNPIASMLDVKNPSILLFVPLIVWLSGSLETLIIHTNREKGYTKISVNRVLSASTSAVYKVTHPLVHLVSGNGLVIGHTIAQLIGLLHILRKLPFTIWQYSAVGLKAIAREYKNFPLFSMPGAVLNLAASAAPVFLISYFDSSEATGQFAYAYKLSYLPLSMLAMSLGQVYFERLSKIKSEPIKANSLSKDLLHLLLALAIIPCIVLFFYGEEIAIFLLGDNWAEAGIYIENTILFYTAMFVSNPFFCTFDVYQKLKQELVFNGLFLVGSVLSICSAYAMGYSTVVALQWFSIIGIALRVGVLHYFFRLLGGYFLSIILAIISLLGIVIYFVQ